MTRTYSWDDTYCPEGHRWVFCGSSTLYSDYYYCPKEDKLYEPKVVEIDEDELAKEYMSDRVGAMKQYGRRNLALEKIKILPFDLIIKIAERIKQ